jgi:predicted HTH domain antitoxin
MSHKIITEKVKELRMKRMAESYHKGTLSLQEAATAANVSLYEMIDFLELHQIYPRNLSEKEMEDHFEYAQEIIKKKRN